MKKVMISFLAIFIATVSMSFNINDDETPSPQSKNSCTVKVTYSSGSGASGVRVVGDVCGGISCSGNTSAVYTDSDGYATIEWSEGCKLCYIYIDGKSYKGNYKDGGSYSFTK